MKKFITIVVVVAVFWGLSRWLFSTDDTAPVESPELPAKQAVTKPPEVETGLGLTTIPTGQGMRYKIVDVTVDAPPATRYPVNQTSLVMWFCELQVGYDYAAHHYFVVVVKYPNTELMKMRVEDQIGSLIYLNDGSKMVKRLKGRRRTESLIRWNPQGCLDDKVIGGRGDIMYRIIDVADHNLVVPNNRVHIKPKDPGTVTMTGEAVRASHRLTWQRMREVAKAHAANRDRRQALRNGWQVAPSRGSAGHSLLPRISSPHVPLPASPPPPPTHSGGHGRGRRPVEPPVITTDPGGLPGSN